MVTQQTTTASKKNVYEAMFLFPSSALANLQAAVDHVLQILERTHAEIISMRKWDERKLAYEIKGNKRGVYFLVFFRAPAENMNHFERDCNLSELLLRSMVLRAEHVTAEQMESIEGRAQLEDEIRMRSEQQFAEGENAQSSAVVETRTERLARIAESGDVSDDVADLSDEDMDDADDSDDREPAVAGGKRDRD